MPNDELQARLEAWLDEARSLRFDLRIPSEADTPGELRSHIVQARSALDRIEEILAHIIRLRGRSRQNLLVAQYALENAEINALAARRVTFPEYATKKERYSWIAQESIEDVNQHRLAEVGDDMVSWALEEMRVLHRGAEAIRREIDMRLRLLGFERQLER